ncbi:blood vessel epicardial substance isoform X1 [Chlorella sorokiniana]|uniref:Blood vessel epicardial substance isoform X1 n=1 Tax=Chlorella sorokiniana TaxID=3076 RepID=A0A2P6TLV6_CHLSO|nr:blood vessel epicardial substance isoform X1 [Chlorella sorokiniana]|eukprot:PRW45226.1 blood vessel epicardial substance isoform X1 [Chlorella sorokiniana]
MVEVLNPSSIWGQLANLCFLLSALFGDLLLIRICLFLAYSWMLVLALVGYPSWPSVFNPDYVSIDGIVWAALNLIFHGLAMLQLMWDERPIKFAGEEQEQLWRYFNRRCGMGRLEMQQVLKRAQRAEYQAGEVILDSTACHTTLVLLVEGLATFTFKDEQGKLMKEATLKSGSTFDIGMLNIFGVYLAFEKGPEEQVTLTASTSCLVYTWGIDNLDYLATRCSPAMPAFWRSFALCQVGLEWHASVNQYKPPVNGRGQPEVAGVRDGTARSSDFTDPLEPWENPRPTLCSVLTWVPSQLAPFLPPGMRHTARPHAGAMARNRLMALGAANRSAASVLRRAPTMARSITRTLISAIHEQDGLFPADGEQMGRGSMAINNEAAAQAAGEASAASGTESAEAKV